MTDLPPPPPAAEEVPAGWEDILAPGEQVLWQGRPLGRFHWQEILDSQSIFGIVFAGFSLFWMAGANRMSSFVDDGFLAFFPLFGLPFLFIGINLVIGRPLRTWLRDRRTWYTLTSQNAFIATESKGRRSLDRHPLAAGLTPVLEEGDPGSVWFAENATPSGRWSARGAGGLYGAAAPPRIGFRDISDARRVWRLMIDAVAQTAGKAGQ